MIFGFTGTMNGMTKAQKIAVVNLLGTLDVEVLHHGCCKGADVEANDFAVALGVKTYGHPSTVTNTQRECTLHKMYLAFPPLVRDKHIVMEGTHGLIATPKTPKEVLRSGTWTTVRYARAMQRKIWIVRPDGTVKAETPERLAL